MSNKLYYEGLTPLRNGPSKGTRRYLRAVAEADAALEKGSIATSFKAITPYKQAEFVEGGAPGTGKH